MKELTAVVLNWRTPELAVRAARALRDDGIPDERIVIVDNASGDHSLEHIAHELPHVHLLALDENVGFGRANNAAARRLFSGRAYLLVNSDAFVHAPGSVTALLAALDDPRVGIVVPRLLNADLTLQPTVVPFASPLPELVRASGLSRFVPNRLQPRLGTHWDHARSREIQSAIGPVLLIRASAWEQLHGFNERIFMYAEDLDLFRRAARLGWRPRFIAEAEFVHLGGASAGKVWNDAQRAYRVGRAESGMLIEHMGAARRGLTVAFIVLGFGLRAIWHILAGNHAAATTYRAWARGWLNPVRPTAGRASTPRRSGWAGSEPGRCSARSCTSPFYSRRSPGCSAR